jgi:energy-coupling factor transporter ATP-binding protein EcfA2
MPLNKSNLLDALPLLEDQRISRSSYATKMRKDNPVQELKKHAYGGVYFLIIAQPEAPLEFKTVDHLEFPYPYLHSAMTDEYITVMSRSIQNILENTEFTPISTIPLPKLQVSNFPIHTRFPFDKTNCTISIMYRAWMKDFIDFCLGKLSEFYFGSPVALTGPQGIGKSHCLYLLVAILRKATDKYRVFYLPSCQYLEDAFGDFYIADRSDISLLTQELIVSFPDIEYQYIINKFKNRTIGLGACLSDLKKMCYTKGIKIVLVLDQYNTIAISSESKSITSFLNAISVDYATIISYSANNNVEVKQEKYEVYKFSIDYMIQKNESKAFCQLFNQNITDLEVEDILNVVGRVPLEIATCLTIDANSVDEKIQQYSVERAGEFQQSVDKYFCETRAEKLNFVLESILDVIVRAGRPGKKHIFFDKKLITEKKHINSSFSYSFINKIALNTVRSYIMHIYKDEVTKQLDSVAAAVLSSDRNNASKGHEIEYYIITHICAHGRFIMKCNEFDIEICDLKTFYFIPLNLSSINFTECNSILIPSITNLPGFDFVIYQKQDHSIYLIQVTVEESAKSHRDNSISALRDGWSQLSFWLTILKNMFVTNQPNYYEVYITKGESGKKGDYNSVRIREMADHFPALAAFK